MTFLGKHGENSCDTGIGYMQTFEKNGIQERSLVLMISLNFPYYMREISSYISIGKFTI